jgi:xanthine dehydrogenase accessory factor
LKTVDFVTEMSKLTQEREPFVVATVVGIEGSTIGKPGFKAIMSRDGHIIHGTIGGVCPESAITAFALDAIKTGRAKTVKVYLEEAKTAIPATFGTPADDEIHVAVDCGGSMMQIYIEPYLPSDRLVILAEGGRNGLVDVLTKLGKFLDFEVAIIDPTPDIEEKPDVLITNKDYDLAKFSFSNYDYVVILTHSAKDVPIMTLLSTKNVRYVGLMGSRDRARGELNFLLKRGVRRDFVESIKSPVGADIGGKTSREIAISIISEIIATKYGKTLSRAPLILGVPLADQAKVGP